ncbi:MAG: hypothetical protein ACLU38_05365 [Dysosmobacter sp.]
MTRLRCFSCPWTRRATRYARPRRTHETRFLIVPSLVLAALLALCILNGRLLNRRTRAGGWTRRTETAQLAAR